MVRPWPLEPGEGGFYESKPFPLSFPEGGRPQYLGLETRLGAGGGGPGSQRPAFSTQLSNWLEALAPPEPSSWTFTSPLYRVW